MTDHEDQQPDPTDPTEQPDPQTCHRCGRLLAGEDTVIEVEEESYIPAHEAPDGVAIFEFGERLVHAAPCATKAERDADDDTRRIIADQGEREERRLPLSEEELEAHRVFGVELRDPDDYGSLA
jgi:hypothetical protein